jgi:sugar transferase (PEP-CTERM system associated)
MVADRGSTDPVGGREDSDKIHLLPCRPGGCAARGYGTSMIRLFKVFVPTSVVGILLSEIILAFFCYTATSVLVMEYDPVIEFFYEGGIFRIAFVVATIILGLYLSDLYGNLHVSSGLRLYQQFCLVIGLAFLAQALLGYVNRHWVVSRWVMMYGSGAALVLMPAWRILYSDVVLHALGQQRALFLGDSPLVHLIAGRMLDNTQYGWRSIGYLSDGEVLEPPPEALGGRMGAVHEVAAITRREKPDLLVVGLTERRGRLPVFDLLDLRLAGFRIEEDAGVYEFLFGRVSVETLRPSQLVFSSNLGPNQYFVTLQNLYSWLVAIAGLVLASPIMLLVALLVRLTSKGSVIYRQRRVGLNNSEFEVYKFRSMYEDAEARSGPVWATRDDPRITPLGRFLRRLRLDELPQLFNVLRGEMSIVGPRPERPEFVKMLSDQIPFYRQRHCVKPGVTGWAQINYKYGETIEDTIAKLEYDLYYIKNLSPSLDLYILFHTAKVMLLSRGSQ